jgi:hypothetical protein
MIDLGSLGRTFGARPVVPKGRSPKRFCVNLCLELVQLANCATYAY